MRPRAVVNVFLNENAVSSNARLARVSELGQNTGLHCVVYVSIVKDDKRAVSPKLQGQFLQSGRALPRQYSTDLLASSETQLRDQRIGTQLSPNVRHQVEDK